MEVGRLVVLWGVPGKKERLGIVVDVDDDRQFATVFASGTLERWSVKKLKYMNYREL